jgi:lauroyl/myristoyl acyltransferase
VGVALRTAEGYDVEGWRLDVDREGDPDDVVYRMTAAFTARLEEVVRSAPDQYLWQHRRWKTRPQ